MAVLSIPESNFAKEAAIYKANKAAYEAMVDKTSPLARYYYNRAIKAQEMCDRIQRAFGKKEVLI